MIFSFARCYILLHFVSLLFCALNALPWLCARDIDFRFSKVASENGLSSDWVTRVYQHDDGFVWIGTVNGLNRYDGTSIALYRLEETVDGLVNEVDVKVNVITRKSAKELWVGTDRGAFVFHVSNGIFSRFEALGSRSVLDIEYDSHGFVWFGTSTGLFRCDERDGGVVEYRNDPEDDSSVCHEYANTVFKDSDGRIWVGTKRGLALFDSKSETFRCFYEEQREGRGLRNDDILDIAQDSFGRMFFASARGGVDMLLDDGSEAFGFRSILEGKSIRILVDREDTLWVGRGAGEGLATVDLSTFVEGGNLPQAREWRNDRSDPYSISSDSIYSLYEDRLGDIWVGTFGNGVNFTSRRAKKINIVDRLNATGGSWPISNDLVNTFFEEDEYFWIGTEGGLERFDKKTGDVHRFINEYGNPRSLGAEAVFDITKDSRGNLWVGLWSGGLNLFDYESRSFTRFLPNGEGSISNANVFAIFEDSRDNLWIGTVGGGLNRYVYETGMFEVYRHEAGNRGSLSADTVFKILETRSGRLLVMSEIAIDEFDYDSGAFLRHSHKKGAGNDGNGGYLVDMFEDCDGRLWVGSTAGLEAFDFDEGLFSGFSSIDGLPSDAVHGILEDSAGNLWLSTLNGLCLAQNAVNEPSNIVFRTIAREEGLLSNQFKKRSAFLDTRGNMYFGTNRGYVSFRPEELAFNEAVPQVVFTDLLQLKSTPDRRATYRVVTRNLNYQPRIEFDSSVSGFIIRFAALNYMHPSRNQYRYKLEGYDERWVNSGFEGSATYTNLPSGEYIFRVQGSNNDGVWSTADRELLVLIRPPWWGTLYFKVLLWALIVALAVAIFRIRFVVVKAKRIHLESLVAQRTLEITRANEMLSEKQEEIESQNRELADHRDHFENLVHERTRELELAKNQAEESDRLKTSFLANMSHEIRTPMNAIIGFSSLLNEPEITKSERDEFVRIIGSNGQALLVLIDDILDISLIDSGQLKLEYTYFDAYSVIRDLKNYYSFEKLGSPPIRLAFDANGQLEFELFGDTVRFCQIVNNLLNNACKFSIEGEIVVDSVVSERDVVFSVSDHGIGIEEEDRERIFESFYKVNHVGPRLFAGTGIGLAICQRLLEMMGGDIWLKSEMGVGTTFSFRLPRLELNTPTRPERLESFDSDLLGWKVLVAEDEETNFLLVQKSLLGSGADVFRARNGREAVDFVRENRSRVSSDFLVLMDIKMPVMDGYMACGLIKGINRSIPIVAVTAYAQQNDMDKAKECGFDGYLSKPFEKQDLLKAIATHVS